MSMKPKAPAMAMNGESIPQTMPSILPEPSAMGLRRSVIVTNPQGLHLRPASAFAKLARQFKSQVSLRRDDRVVNGKSQVELILLPAEPRTELMIEVDGPDADVALSALAELLARPSSDDDADDTK